MNYPLENLGPERFQEFCQALLLREHPNVQCFPVAQPDGGRDAVSYISEQSAGKFVIFQVKYSRRPLAESEPHKWLLAIMDEEIPKIKKLVPRGATQFYLITNIQGTAHLDVGSMDQLNARFHAELSVPFMCWWRDDINRRLDNAWAVKWVYPELMTGPDFLRAIVESGLSEHRERRESAIRAFLAQQYSTDEQVRFKQVELQNNLIDLFVDVPVAFRESGSDYRQSRLFQGIVSGLVHRTLDPYDAQTSVVQNDYREHGEAPIGAAALLLDAQFQSRLPHIVLEGAPGQGKSTITQYVCQVHRMTLLKDAEAREKLPLEHRKVAPRLPIRIDLRDFATWLGKQDPFAGDERKEPPAGWRKSLESFIAALIGFHSGGTNFTTDDLVAVFKISSVLIVLDGLDEVADINRRHEVVEEIMKGIQRLEANAASLQTVVTSRPAAFANSPGMPPDKYPYFHLASLTQSQINQYADKWLRVRHIDGKEASDFRKTLKEKLEYPHLRDLARNPMQLTILLSLILTRGSSLPDKRTALYDSYVDLFFNRESEKSPVVREHRDLLIDIHRYLAWVLQSEAEQGTARGSISQDRLQQTLKNYLAREEQPTNLARELFTGMVERVVFLVSRVEGTFEFEVQPLREYFAARFLYETAPYSPPGKEQRGTKPDRFDALARNFYWTNVTRFYAGCFSKGELPALVERLEELVNEEGFKTTTHPRMLACTLLADWVFSQNPKSVSKVVRLVLDGIGLRYLLASGPYARRHRTPWNPIALPPKCGREELVKRAFDILAGGPAADYGFEIVELLRANVASVDEAVSAWRERLGSVVPSRWLEYGLRLGVLSRVDLTEIAELVERPDCVELPLNLLYRARRLDYLERNERTFELSVAAILRRELLPQHQRRVESALDALSNALDLSRYAAAFSNRVPVALSKVLAQQNRVEYLRWGPELATNTELYQSHTKCIAVAALAQEESEKTAAEWATEITPWERIVEAGRAEWGDRWAFFCLANLAAGIKSGSERCREFPDLLDRSQSLCRRARHARLKSGQKMWWKGQFSAVRTPEDRMVVSLVAMTWATPDTLVAIHESLNDALAKLDDQQWHQVFTSSRLSMALANLRKEEIMTSFDSQAVTEGLSPRTVVALASRAAPETAHQLHQRFFASEVDDDPAVLEFVQGEALDVERFGTRYWKPDLQRIQRCYEFGALEPYMPALIRRRSGTMPLAVAKAIASDPSKYPSYLVSLADESCTRSVARRAKTVADVAKREGWFGELVTPRLFDS
jgi:NACHT domain